MLETKNQPSKNGRKMDGTFTKGSVPNPKGRPRGSRNKATIIAQQMLDGQSEELVSKAIELALDGDQTMLRICLERLVPVRKDSPISVRLPRLDGIEKAGDVMKKIVRDVANSKLTVEEGNKLISMVERYVGIVELSDLEARVQKLEER